MKVKSVKFKRGYMQIAEQIMDLMAKGELAPGDRLPSEREMADLFETSRATVREAMSALELVGVVETRVGIGSFVTGNSFNAERLLTIQAGAAPSDFLEFREVLEPALARLAAERAEPADLKKIRDLVDDCWDAARANDAHQFELRDEQFHKAISKGAHNPLMHQVTLLLSEMRAGKLWQSMKQQRALSAQHLHEYAEQHERIAEAIQAHDGMAAFRRAAEHLESVRKNLLDENGDE